ncbi:MAG: DUF4129 domain-containing protein [Bacteroidota bacterium]
MKFLIRISSLRPELKFLMLLGICWLVASPAGYAQSPVAETEIREYRADQLEAYQQDEAFQYGIQPLPPGQKKRKEQQITPPKRVQWGQILKYLIYFVVGAALLGLAGYIISRTMGKGSKFVSTAGIPDLAETDIREVPFQNLLQQAISQGAYRNAVRLLFLENLKHLTEAELIHWKQNKTNYDYQAELQGNPLAEDFRQLILAYEYVWYGNLQLSPDQFAQIHQRFSQFQQQVPSAS